MITYTTINREIAESLRELRLQWMPPAKECSDKRRGIEDFWKRFACAFVGAITFLVALVLSRFVEQGIDDYRVFPIYTNLLGIVLLMGIPYSIWFSWLVSWRNFGHGPVRLFLSGIFLPAFVYTVIGFVLTRFADS